jgi:hypothetical protein
MRGVIDRFKAMDRFCFVEGDMNGALTLRVENDRCVPCRQGGISPTQYASISSHGLISN